MKTYAIITMKGGAGKTISSINIAHILAAKHGKAVLLVDMDKQGNTSKFMKLYGYDSPSIADVLTEKNMSAMVAVQETPFERLHIIPANMDLQAADKKILLDVSRQQQTRLSKALEDAAGLYDFCIIDNAPGIYMSTINALVASDCVLVPLTIDKFAFDGLGELIDQIEELQDFNPRLYIMGCFVTQYRSNNSADAEGLSWLRNNCPMPMMHTAIRATVRVKETTFHGKPLLLYAPNSTATQDYISLVDEIIKNVSVTDTF